MKHCVDCVHYDHHKSIAGGWWNNCKAPDVVIHQDGPIRKTVKYGSCYAERGGGVLGFFAGKCGPQAVLFKQKNEPVPPGSE